jgi:hypothetical protein
MVAKRKQGGYECELDIVAFNPETKHLVHIETSMDADSWETRERRFGNKFKLGKTYVPKLFAGIDIPGKPEQIALLCFASTARHKSVGGGRIMLVPELLREILDELKSKKVASKAVPPSSFYCLERCNSSVNTVGWSVRCWQIFSRLVVPDFLNLTAAFPYLEQSPRVRRVASREYR